MPQIWVLEYTGVPPAEVFNSTAGWGTPIIVNSATGIAYYYKEGTGVQAINSPSAAGISDHGGLTGLGDDDHTQYHNDARGDARYAAIAHVGSGGTAHSVATTLSAGFMSAADKVILDSLAGQPVWTYVFLSADETVSAASPSDSSLSFTPDASGEYIIEANLVMETSSPGNAPCPGVSWPASPIGGIAEIRVAEDATTTEEIFAGDSGADFRAAPSGTAGAFSAHISASLITSGGSSGTFAVTLSSET